MNLQSPVTETELKAKATAPRVTEETLKENIKSVEFTRMAEVLTICVITLQNGFTVMGESACASVENYNREIGERLAYQMAERKIWPLMGYALRERLHADAQLLAAMAVPPHVDPEMPSYIGTKVVHARPMTRGAYNEMRGWQIPANEDPSEPGYLVEYTDRVEPVEKQVAGFAGYISWSPKPVFEAAYRQVDAQPKPESFLDRMKAELNQLSARARKLSAFLGSGMFLELPLEQRHLLGKQLSHMEGYEEALTKRYALLKAPD